MKFFLISFFLCVSLSFSAQAFMGSEFEAPLAFLSTSSVLRGDSPKPITGGFVFSEGKALWDASRQPTEQELLGSWKEIGWADVSIQFANRKNAYDEAGLQNEDGTFRELLIELKTLPVSGRTVISYRSLNLGSEDTHQGPYEAFFDVDTKSVVMSTFLFAREKLAKSYTRNDCRISSRNNDQLICAITLKLDPSEIGWISEGQLALNNVQGGIQILQRIR